MPGSPDHHQRRIRFAGVWFDPLTVEETCQVLESRGPAEPFSVYVTPNVEFIYLRRKHAEMRELFCETLVCVNDSRITHRVALWAGLELGFAPGAYAVAHMFRHVIKPDDAICVIGFSAEGLQALRDQFGLTNIVQHIPPMGFINDEQAVRETIEFVAAHPSRYVMVAMGPPQSERLCRRLQLDGRITGVGLCIGSSLNVLSGKFDPAPAWMEQRGLVWLYRLIREPRRLWRRYLVNDLVGLALCLADLVALRLRLRARIA